MSITAKAIWGKALAEFKKDRETPGGVSFSYISNVNRAYNNYISMPSKDNFTDLYKQVFEAYGCMSQLFNISYPEFENMVDTLYETVGDKMNGNEFKNIIRSYDSDKSSSDSFLLYFHSCIKRQYIKKAEKERDENKNSQYGYDLSEKSKESYRKISKCCYNYFGCKPEELNDSEVNDLYRRVKEDNILGSKCVTFKTFCMYIEENSKIADEVYGNESGNKDAIQNIPDDNDFTQNITGGIVEPVNTAGTDTQIYYLGITTTHNWLYDVYQKEKDDDSENYVTALTDEYNLLRKEVSKILKFDSNKFDEGCEKVFSIILDHVESGKEFPTMDTVSKELGFTGQSTITRNAKKLADKLRRLLKS